MTGSTSDVLLLRRRSRAALGILVISSLVIAAAVLSKRQPDPLLLVCGIALWLPALIVLRIARRAARVSPDENARAVSSGVTTLIMMTLGLRLGKDKSTEAKSRSDSGSKPYRHAPPLPPEDDRNRNSTGIPDTEERRLAGGALKRGALSEGQIKILDLIGEHQLDCERESRAERDFSGRLLRKKVAPATLEALGIGPLLRDRHLGALAADQISPFWIRRTLTYPEDRYELMLWGWVNSRYGAKVRQLLDGTLALFRKLDDERPEFKSYSWEDLKTAGVVSDESDFYLVQLVWRCLRWPVGAVGAPWKNPTGIEDLMKVRDHRELLRLRWQAEVQGDAAYVAALERVRRGLPFLEDDVPDTLLSGMVEFDDLPATWTNIVIHNHNHVHGDVVGSTPARAAPTMSNATRILNHDHILRLQTAITSARLTRSRDALLAHISDQFVASLPVAPVPGEQVLMDLDALNAAGELADGSLPLAIWLSNAIPLCGGRQEEKVFAEALERVQPGAAARARARSRQSTSSSREAEPAAAVVHHHHGEVHMGSKFVTNISGSTVGAFAQGDHAVATGHVTIGAAGAPTQAQHQEHIKAAKKALADDEERLEAKVYEALEKFLKQAREVKVEARPVAEVQDEIQGILDRIWAEQTTKTLPKGLNVTNAMAKSPVMSQATKKLIGA